MSAQNELTHREFWEQHYTSVKLGSSGRPSWILVQFAEALTPGRALDLGCAHGDDVRWLAERGWQAVGTDISATVIDRATERAKSAGLEANARFERHDLAVSFPTGRYDLVTAFYLQSPHDFERVAILRRAAAAVARGGLLLVVTHASVPPWSWADPDTVFTTPDDAYADLRLSAPDWRPEFIGAPERQAEGPEGQTATVRDTVLALRRRGLS